MCGCGESVCVYFHANAEALTINYIPHRQKDSHGACITMLGLLVAMLLGISIHIFDQASSSLIACCHIL